MDNFNQFETGYNIISIVIPLVALAIFTFVILMIFSPKIRAKFMSKQISATKYMLDESKKDLTDIASASGNIIVKSTANIVNENKGNIENIASTLASASKDGITTTVKAIKDGIKDYVYCKHCGKKVDNDSKYCKHCGKSL